MTTERVFAPASCVRCGLNFYDGGDCPRCSRMQGWTVIGVDRTRRGPFEVHRSPGMSDLDVVNRAAEIAGERKDIIYTAVREDRYRNSILDGIRWMSDRNYEAVNARVYRGV
jgi:hypothetical protein